MIAAQGAATIGKQSNLWSRSKKIIKLAYDMNQWEDVLWLTSLQEFTGIVCECGPWKSCACMWPVSAKYVPSLLLFCIGFDHTTSWFIAAFVHLSTPSSFHHLSFVLLLCLWWQIQLFAPKITWWGYTSAHVKAAPCFTDLLACNQGSNLLFPIVPQHSVGMWCTCSIRDSFFSCFPFFFLSPSLYLSLMSTEQMHIASLLKWCYSVFMWASKILLN